MKERPILFNGVMVQAILEDRKTNTRREMKPQPDETGSNGGKITGIKSSSLGWGFDANYFGDNPKHVGQCPFGKPGDRLYVRESAWIYGEWHKNGLTSKGRQKWRFKPIGQKVSFQKPGVENIAYFGSGPGYTFRPSIHMPRWASRITLEIVSVRVERLNQISEADAKAEGINMYEFPVPPDPPGQMEVRYGLECYFPKTEATAVRAFQRLWQSVYGPGSFDDRWVWVVEFKRL